jgi:hypothetical protein
VCLATQPGIVSSSNLSDPERSSKPIHHSQVEIEGGKFPAMSKRVGKSSLTVISNGGRQTRMLASYSPRRLSDCVDGLEHWGELYRLFVKIMMHSSR